MADKSSAQGEKVPDPLLRGQDSGFSGTRVKGKKSGAFLVRSFGS